MTIVICPRCFERVVANHYDSDVAHECNSNSDALNQYDRPDILAAGYNRKGIENLQGGKYFGTDKQVKILPRTPRGARAPTHYQRQYVEYIAIAQPRS